MTRTRRYRVAFERIGTNHDVPDLTTSVIRPDKLAQAICDHVQQFRPGAVWISLSVDPAADTVTGYLHQNIGDNLGDFTVTEVTNAEDA